MRLGSWSLVVVLVVAVVGGAACSIDQSALVVGDADSALDAAVPDTGRSDTRPPDTSVPDTSVPDTSVPDTSMPDTSMPDTSVPTDAAAPCATHAIATCAASHVEIGDCANLHDGLEVAPRCPTQSTVTLSCRDGGLPSYCDTTASCPDGDGCVRDVWFQFDLGEAKAVDQLRFMAGWWADRPDRFEVWYGDSPTEYPDAGATIVYSGSADTKPWRCVEGEACTVEVPDGCCPNGRGSPQVTDQSAYAPSCDLGRYFPKFNTASFARAVGRYWYLMVRDGVYDDRIILDEVELRHGAMCD